MKLNRQPTQPMQRIRTSHPTLADETSLAGPSSLI